MAAQMTDAHRRFLQVLMSNGITEGSEARKLHQHCCETDKGVSVSVMKELGFFLVQLTNNLISEGCAPAKKVKNYNDMSVPSLS